VQRHAAPALFLASALAAFAGSYALSRAPDAPESQLAATLAAELVFACCAVGGVLLLRRDPVPALRLERPALRGGEIAALVAGFVCISHALSLALASLALRDTGTLAEIDRVVAASTGPSLALAFLAVGVAPAFGEELLFRGFVQQTALPRLGVKLAVAISAALFALIHLDPVQSPAAFVLGVYLGAVVELGGGLWVAILCHAVNNSLALVGQVPLDLPSPGLVWTLAGTLFAAGVMAITWVALRVRRRQETAVPPGAST
jgi:membrane protease YdiL (CAAX protease family)